MLFRLGVADRTSALTNSRPEPDRQKTAPFQSSNRSESASFQGTRVRVYVTPQGLASSSIPDGPGIEILFDLREHKVGGTCGNGRRNSFDLGPMTVAAFHASFVQLISDIGGTPTFNGSPNEVPYPVPSPKTIATGPMTATPYNVSISP